MKIFLTWIGGLALGGLLILGVALLVAPTSLVSIHMYNPRTGESIECDREPSAAPGKLPTPIMNACLTRMRAQGFIQGYVQR